jgi:MFS family permease
MNKFKLIFISGIGTLFESYDFYLFTIFAVPLNKAFFEEINQDKTLWIFLIFSIGYLARVIGAFLFGYWGDRIGRQYAFRLTIIIMALSSISIGLIPLYNTIGILAIIFLILLRFTQGISYGGEYSGATILIVEQYKKHQPILIMFLSIMIISGIFLAKIVYSLIEYFYSHDAVINYGWRIAYIFGGLLILHSYFIRKKINESIDFALIKKNNRLKNSVIDVLKNHKVLLLLAILSLSSTQSYWGVFMVYQKKRKAPRFIYGDISVL